MRSWAYFLLLLPFGLWGCHPQQPAPSNFHKVDTLIIHGEDYGKAEFHREDNRLHPYPASSKWIPYILPAGAKAGEPLVIQNADGSFSVFVTNVHDLLLSAAKISKALDQKISVLNIHGHGFPGGMELPANEATYTGPNPGCIGRCAQDECQYWRQSITSPYADRINYERYYSGESKESILGMKQMAEGTGSASRCSSPLWNWASEARSLPELQNAFMEDAQIHFLACLVGYGRVGAQFVRGIAEILLKKSPKGHVEALTTLGLSDWSVADGEGFWDYLNDAQLERDRAIYSQDKEDEEKRQMQGSLLVASYADGAWGTQLVEPDNYVLSPDFDRSLADLDSERSYFLGDSIRQR